MPSQLASSPPQPQSSLFSAEKHESFHNLKEREKKQQPTNKKKTHRFFSFKKKEEYLFSNVSMTAFWWGPMSREVGTHPQHHGGHSVLPTCTRLSPNGQAGPARSHGTGHGRGPGAMSPEPGTPHQHLAGRGHSTASLGGSRGRQPQAATAPAATTHHKGKLRHDGFKHTSAGQARPCTLPGTITSMIPRSTVPEVRCPEAPRGTITRSMMPEETQYPAAQYPRRHDLWRHDTPRPPIPRGAIPRNKTSKEP